ncbi:MAG: LuxR family transcriptional regulator [Hyphomicrobium sp.]|jgi:DNA-binding CsgD family transcriptional regulator
MMIDVAQYIRDTNAAGTVDTAFSHLEGALAKLGFDRIVYSLITDHPRLRKKRQHGIVRNYPEDWMSHYFSRGYVDVDPVISVIKQRAGAFAWEQLERVGGRPLSNKETVLMHEAREARLLDGIGISFHNPTGEIVGMGVASSSGKTECSRNTISLIQLLCTQFNQVFQDIETESTAHEQLVTLSRREREILTWLAVGKSRSVTADIVGISEHTVKTYLQRVFAKLGTCTTQEAVVRAIRLGLIAPDISRGRNLL